jgi:hypothetical protein
MRTQTVATLTALIFATACVSSPTEPDVRAADHPSLDGGWTAGSGNRTASDSGAVTVSNANTCEEQGGWTAGSGNQVADPPSCGGPEGL